MLLVDVVLARAARIWRFREKVEWEAADAFSRLAVELDRFGGEGSGAMVRLAEKAALDERSHAAMCRRLVDSFEPGLGRLAPVRGVSLGPRSLPRRRRALYASVALSCITETLSVALLVDIRRLAGDERVLDTAHRILKDEIDHSRLGWAHLASEARRGDVGWLAEHVPAMLREAVRTDCEPLAAPAAPDELEAYGVLSRGRVEAIYEATVRDVIVPGLEQLGVHTGRTPRYGEAIAVGA